MSIRIYGLHGHQDSHEQDSPLQESWWLGRICIMPFLHFSRQKGIEEGSIWQWHHSWDSLLAGGSGLTNG